MFSGKSEELIRRVRRAVIARKKVQVFKSHLDARYAGIYSISSHDGRTVEAIPADSAAQIGQQIDPIAHVVAIDEAHEQTGSPHLRMQPFENLKILGNKARFENEVLRWVPGNRQLRRQNQVSAGRSESFIGAGDLFEITAQISNRRV